MKRKRLTLHQPKGAPSRSGTLTAVATAVPAPSTVSPDAMAYFTDSAAGQVVGGIRGELPGLLAVAVVDVETGMSLASFSTSPAFDADTAAAYHAEVLKQQRQAMHALQLGHERAEDLLVTLEGQLHLLRLSTDGSQFLYLAVSPQTTNLAIAREVIRRYAQRL